LNETSRFLHKIIDEVFKFAKKRGESVVCSLSDLRNKEVINIKNGAKLGFVDDVEINTVDASVLALIVYGRPRFFGIFGRDDDIVIKCKDIDLIGEDTILVSFENLTTTTKSRSFSVENLLK